MRGLANRLSFSLIALMIAMTARAQEPASLEQPRAAQYFLGSQDQVLMPVNVWGFVHKPGQYMVPYETDLISLLSFAGGPREEARIKSIRLVRPDNGGGAAQVIEVDVKKYLESGKASEIPVLRPGDTVVVSGTSFHFVNQFFEFAVRIGALIQVWALVDFYRRN
jgi:polysaccharide biosynthesis/export protein